MLFVYCWLFVVYYLLFTVCWLLVVGDCLLVIGHCLLVPGCWILLVVSIIYYLKFENNTFVNTSHKHCQQCF